MMFSLKSDNLQIQVICPCRVFMILNEPPGATVTL